MNHSIYSRMLTITFSDGLIQEIKPRTRQREMQIQTYEEYYIKVWEVIRVL